MLVFCRVGEAFFSSVVSAWWVVMAAASSSKIVVEGEQDSHPLQDALDTAASLIEIRPADAESQLRAILADGTSGGGRSMPLSYTAPWVSLRFLGRRCQQN
jgi:hypothetical protein